MVKVGVTQGQNLFDVALQEYGSPEYVFKIIEDNDGITLNSNIGAGVKLNIDETFVGSPDVGAFFKAEKSRDRFPVNYSDAETGDYSDDYNNDYNI